MLTVSEIQAAAVAGESETAEFKAATGQRTQAARTLSAMLNGSRWCGRLQSETGWAGLRPRRLGLTREDIAHACREIRPPLPPSIARIELGDGSGKQTAAMLGHKSMCMTLAYAQHR